MDAEVFHLLLKSVCKWGRTEQDRVDMFTLCLENYYLKLAGKELKIKTREKYLSVLFRNSCLDILRVQRSHRKHEILLTDMKGEWKELMSMTENPHNETLHELLTDDFLKTLDGVDRTLALGLLDDIPYELFIEQFKVSPSTVRTRIHRLRKHWKQIPQLKGVGV